MIRHLIILCLPVLAAAQSTAEYRAHIIRYEGYSFTRYHDIYGRPHIGIGHQLIGKERAMRRATRAQVERLFETDLSHARAAAERLVPNLADHPKDIRIMVVALVLNVGPTGFRRFVRLRKALEIRDYHRAALELNDSLWARQLPNRARAYGAILSSYSSHLD